MSFIPEYSEWRHGGWYVNNVRYAGGACGCVSRNYADKKWRIVCDEREPKPTFPSRDAAARAEYDLAEASKIAVCQNCDWKGNNPAMFAGRWADWIGEQDESRPVILPVGDCPECGVPVYCQAAIDRMTKAGY